MTPKGRFEINWPLAKNSIFAQIGDNIIGTEHSAIWRTAQVTLRFHKLWKMLLCDYSSIIDYLWGAIYYFFLFLGIFFVKLRVFIHWMFLLPRNFNLDIYLPPIPYLYKFIPRYPQKYQITPCSIYYLTLLGYTYQELSADCVIILYVIIFYLYFLNTSNILSHVKKNTTKLLDIQKKIIVRLFQMTHQSFNSKFILDTILM